MDEGITEIKKREIGETITDYISLGTNKKLDTNGIITTVISLDQPFIKLHYSKIEPPKEW